MILALRPILYRCHTYKVGESLPEDDAGMVRAWIDAGSAKEAVEAATQILEESAKTHSRKKAKRAAGRPGEDGLVDAGPRDAYGRDIPGVVPRRNV